MRIKVIRSRNWDLIPFDKTRIELAIEKATIQLWYQDLSFIEELVEKIILNLKNNLILSWWEKIFEIEEIQDIVEISLMEEKFFDIAKSYIIYRSKRNKIRKEQKEEIEKKLEQNILEIIKSDWSKQNFDIEKVKNTYKIASFKLARKCKFEELEQSLKKYIVEWIKSEDILRMMIKSAIDLISIENTNWQFIAWRLKLLEIYKKASKNRKMDIRKIYEAKEYLDLFNTYIKEWLYYKDFYKYYSEKDILQAWSFLKKETDFSYNYTTMIMYDKRYLLNPNKKIMELPQEMYMSVALFLAIPEEKENRLETAKKIYDYCSTWKISLPTPTLLNSRTNFNQLSSCFKFNIDDDLRTIYHNIENMAQVSKFWWWIWVYLWNIRSKWWYIRWVNWVAWWVNPWIKIMNDTAIAVNQLWARVWSISVTLDVFHRDIYDFLDLQTETWDIRSKSFDIFPAVSFPDLFIQRVEKDENWTLFDPKEVFDKTWKKLQEHFWEEFNKFYIECENNQSLTLKETINAKELFKTYLKTNIETWMPYAFFRDTVNKLNPNKHVGNIYSSQLCVEICQNTSPSKFIEEKIEDGKIVIKYEAWDNVVCNLASINVSKVNKDEDIKNVIAIAMRILDNVIDLNYYPIKESLITAKKYRSVGLWFLWLAEYLANSKLSYDSIEARNAVDILFEKYAYHTLLASNNLAEKRWKYEVFDWSERSKWRIFWKDKNWFSKNSYLKNDWLDLIDNIQKKWLRFAYHLAPAPNTSTSLVVWTTASVLPIYKKYFVETNSIAPSVNVAPNLNQDNFWYYKEYVNINLNDVIDMMAIIYKWIDQSISFEWIINPANTSPKDLYNYYMKSHKAWIKTVYYVRSMSLDVKNCESCSG